jgi:hypothetical protein
MISTRAIMCRIFSSNDSIVRHFTMASVGSARSFLARLDRVGVFTVSGTRGPAVHVVEDDPDHVPLY